MNSLHRDSQLISRTLSRIGYNEDIRLFRQKTYDIVNESLNSLQDINICYCASGSKAEGLSSVAENDYDTMCIVSEAVCFEYPLEDNSRCHVFKLLKKNEYPGYAYLQLVSINDRLKFVDDLVNCLVEPIPGQIYLSSDIWKTFLKQLLIEHSNHTGIPAIITSVSRDNHGPAMVALTNDVISHDFVFALKCFCPSFLNAWVNRDRRYQWPSPEVINAVSNLEAHVVPVGCIDSPLQFIEWRICYTKAEICLVRSLNDCLIKTFILMKGIAKVTLKTICKEMSTYIMKNIILWIAENSPAEFFSENNLIKVLQFALRVLKSCLISNVLPSYMIPERNLIADRVTIEQTSKLCMRIDCLLKEGSKMVLRIEKVRNALAMLYCSPKDFISFTERRHTSELEFLQLRVYILQAYMTRNTDDAETFLRDVLADSNFVIHEMNRRFPGLNMKTQLQILR